MQADKLVHAVNCATAIIIVYPKPTFGSSFEDTEAPFRRDPGNDRVVDHPVRYPVMHQKGRIRLSSAQGWRRSLWRRDVINSSKEP